MNSAGAAASHESSCLFLTRPTPNPGPGSKTAGPPPSPPPSHGDPSRRPTTRPRLPRVTGGHSGGPESESPDRVNGGLSLKMRKVVVILLVVHIHYGISFMHAISDMKHIRRFGAHTQLNAVNKKVDKYKPQQSLDPSAGKATKTSVAKQYQYVQGGFNEVRAPKSSDNSTTTMYAAFDSALRASSYNMFCSPLLPVEPPTPFKKKKSEQKFDVKSATVDEYQERAREEAGQILKQYQELDRYLSSTGPTKKIKGNKESEISSVSTQNDMREWLDAAQSPSSIVDEDYEQLESLLGFERIGATSQMNSGTFKGNMSKHRAV